MENSKIIGKKVNHKIFGAGKITSFKDNLMTVSFRDKESTLIFPDCFNTVISTDDTELMAYVKMIIKNRTLEKRLNQKKALNNRVYYRRPKIPRWHSYMSTQNKNTETKDKKICERYSGVNCFIYNISETVDNFPENNTIEFLREEDKGLSTCILKNDLVFLCEQEFVKFLGIVSGVDKEENKSTLTLQIIPVMGEVKFDIATHGPLCHIDASIYKTILKNIENVCPYITGIEGIMELL